MFVPSQSSVEGGSAILVRANGGTTVLADPRLGVVCSTWAHDALDGTPHGSWGSRLFGQRTGWLTWHWREVAAGVGAGLGVVAALWLAVVRRRRGRRP